MKLTVGAGGREKTEGDERWRESVALLKWLRRLEKCSFIATEITENEYFSKKVKNKDIIDFLLICKTLNNTM